MRDVSFPLRDMRFPSGLRVIVEEDHRSPVVAVVTVVGAGSTSDPPGKEGLAHYLEHLAFRARPDGKMSIWNLLGRAGAGQWNAATGLDYTTYWEVGPKESLPALVTLEGVRLLAPVEQIPPETAAAELDVVRNELRERNETGFVGATLAHLQKALFPANHPYARPTIGSHESLGTLTLDDARAFAKQHYRPDNTTMVVVGDVDLQTVNRIIEESLPPALRAGAAPATPAPRLAPVAPAPPDPPPAPEGGLARYQAAVETPELWIGWTLPRSFDADGYLAHFAAIALRSQLHRAYRVDPDISGFGVHVVPGKEATMLLCRVPLLHGSHPERSMDHVLNQVHGIWNWSDGRLRGERTRARMLSFVQLQRSAVTGMILDVEDPASHGVDRATATHFSGDAAMASRALRSVTSVGVSTVVDFAYKYLARDRARAVLVTPVPGSAAPAEGAASTGFAPLDEAPPALGADAIARFIRAPGVSRYSRTTLENGLEVIIGRRAGLPVATVGLSLHGGTATATPAGASELSEWLSVAKVTSKIEPSDFGGHLRDWYDKDDLSYRFEGSAGNVASMLEMLADRAPSMRVDSGVVPFFIRETIPFLKRAENAPGARANRAFWAELYGEHPYGRSVVADDLEKLSAGDADGWVDRVVVPKNAVLAVVGEVEPEQVLAQVRDTFGRWSSSAPPQAPPPPPALPSAKAPAPIFLVTHRPGATQGEIRFGCLLPPAQGSGAERAVLASLLGERLQDTLRRRLGASYGMHASAHSLRGGAAHLTVRGDVDNGRLPRALIELKRALDALEHGKFAPGEIDAARWRVARSYGTRFLTNASIVSTILGFRNEDRDLTAIDAFPGDLAAVTADALAASFARCNTAPVLSLVGDEPALRAAIAAAWP